ncbi:tyrosine-protein phosphatase non-receptor type 23 [Ostrinia furnacalis]|uniref:tyrosine-protein phosphatase non-receptor type 23 n=1 Tax=Ostrinia furnacalis TaxID=93504 RepID=UPI00103F335A|nr:tyrosine-protein phosphatase non-receptor type 23 [Ostrinia furnacalis]
MEAVPKLPLISFELKVSPENTHFGPKLKQYIAEAYREDPESYSNEIHQLEGLRSAAVRPSLDSAGLSALVRYFCQLRALQSRFPMVKGQPVACSFAWKDLYANMSCSLADIRFEMACILYNIGALYTQLAASEPRTSADSLKASCTKYQNAAWAFLFLREQYTQPSGVDVSSEIMRLLQEICFAQAQECILDKSIQDTKKPSVVGAVAIQVLFFYKNALALLGPSTGTDNIHEIIGTKLYNYWHRYLSFKVGYIGCIVCLYQGMNAEEQQKMGERVAYYQQAADKLADARKLAKYIEPTQITQEALTFTNDVVEGKKKAAKNENEFIYHEEVPDKDLLLDLKPVCLVKAIPINLNDPEISGPDIFARLVPMVAHEAASMYSEEKAKLLRHIVTQVEAKNTELTEFMSSLQLDQLDVLDSDQKIPQEIVDRCAAMNAKTEIIQTLVDSMNNLAEIISDVEHSLAEIKNLIQEETSKEKEFQKVMGPRPPSIVQTELSREFHKYQDAHARTSESNQVLHKAMTLHIANLRLLAQPLDALQEKIPSIENIEGLDRETMAEMRRVVGKAGEMQAQRGALVQQLRDAVTADDITAKLLARPNEPADEIFRQELEKHAPKSKIIEQNLAAQENIINKLTSLYASYGDSRRMLAEVLRKREGLINALITSYDTYEELLGKSQKGQEFYKKLSHNVNQLLARLRSTCQVQEEERAQQLSKQTVRASTPSTTPPIARAIDAVPPPLSGGGRKLKDYLPYMKNRNVAPRSITPQAQVDSMPPDTYYPESIYPTSVRPTPVGSEATDQSQMKVPDGVVMPNPYRYGSPYAPSDSDPYAVQSNYAYPLASKPNYDKPEDMNYGYSTPYTPSQYSSQIPDPQTYNNPYYTATHNSSTVVTDSSNPNPYNNVSQASVLPSTSQYNPYTDPYGVQSQLPAVPETSSMSSYNNQNPNNTDMNVNFAQMQISGPKSEAGQPNMGYGSDYSQTYYSVQYPQAATPSMSTYSHAPHHANTSVTPSQIPTDYSALNYPYTGDSQYTQQATIMQQVNPNAGPIQPNPNTTYTQPINPNASTGYGQPDPNVASYNQQNLNTGYIPPVDPNATAGYNQSVNQNVPTGYNQSINPNAAAGYTQPVNQNVSAAYSQPATQNVPAGYSQPVHQNVAASYSQPATQNVSAGYTQPVNPNASAGYSQPVNVSASAGYIQPLNPNASTAYSSAEYNYATSGFATVSETYPIYTNTESAVTSTTSLTNVPVTASQPYGYPAEPDSNMANSAMMANIDAFDKPIKSHVTGEALSSNINFQPSYQNYDQNAQTNFTNPQPQDQSFQPNNTNPYSNDANVNYVQTFQNHPGYGYNNATGGYDYAYGSQNSYVNYTMGQSNAEPKNQNWSGQYTSAGACDTVQSPSDQPQNMVPQSTDQTSNQTYYNAPYGYQTIQPNDTLPATQPESTNYGASMNQSTYMQSGHAQNTSVTFMNNQVSSPKEEIPEPNYNQNASEVNNQTVQAPVETVEQVEKPVEKPVEKKPVKIKSEEKPEPSVFDLLSDIDFTVEQKPLMPEIKVPPISESAIKKPLVVPKVEPQPKPVPKEEVVERPAKMDLISDPMLLNQFTQEVKALHKMLDKTSSTNSTREILDLKWKSLMDSQNQNIMYKSKSVALEHGEGNDPEDVVPFDDSRLILKSNPDAYINASFFKRLASWCIPLVISSNPPEDKHSIFWKAVIENKITCVVCLQSEIEMQGNFYWPTNKGQALELEGDVKVSLDDVKCGVHWTERKLTVSSQKSVVYVSHFQVNVFPVNRIACAPLVLLADRILYQTYESRLSNQLCGAWLQDARGGGRCAVLALLLMAMCQVRAGQPELSDMLETGCVSLYKHRTNALQEQTFLVDAYKTALFYVQGVLCSGTTMFNGETVSVPAGAPILPLLTPNPSVPTTTPSQPTKSSHKPKSSRESFEEMKQSPGLKTGDMKDPLNFLDPLWSLKKK